MKALDTTRLIIDELTTNDAVFMLEMLNDPQFIKYVADRGVRTEQQASTYISERVIASYIAHGFGMAAVRLKENGKTIGMCGLVKRSSLQDIDIGYGFLPEYRGTGYAFEAAQAVMNMGRSDFGLRRLCAIIHPDNQPSIALAKKIGMRLDSMIRLAPEEEKICFYLWSD